MIKEITEKYDSSGKLIERTTKFIDTGSEQNYPFYPVNPCMPYWYVPYYPYTYITNGQTTSATVNL